MGTDTVAVRMADRGDAAGILSVEQWLDLPWDWSDHAHFLDRQDRGTVVAVDGDHVAGFACLSAADRAVQVVRMGVHPSYRRGGVGRGILGVIASHMLNRKYPKARALVGERAVDQQMFLRACGWKCKAIVAGDGADDEYLFEVRRPK